jgi:hypothetical protein
MRKGECHEQRNAQDRGGHRREQICVENGERKHRVQRGTEVKLEGRAVPVRGMAAGLVCLRCEHGDVLSLTRQSASLSQPLNNRPLST